MLLSLLLFAQGISQTYMTNIKIAQDYYNSGKFDSAAKAYQSAFKSNNVMGTIEDRLNLARSFVKINESDSAFNQLFRIVEKGFFDDKNALLNDESFNMLKGSAKWTKLIETIESRQKGKNLSMKSKLESIYDRDQLLRVEIEKLMAKGNKKFSKIEILWQRINKNDETNRKDIEKILDSLGWLGPSEVGIKANTTFFLVIQHAPLEFQKHYFPVMQKAVKEGKARGSDLAYLEDRIALSEGKKQVYGTQVSFTSEGKLNLSPLADPENVDKRRKSVGLGPLEDYLRTFEGRKH